MSASLNYHARTHSLDHLVSVPKFLDEAEQDGTGVCGQGGGRNAYGGGGWRQLSASDEKSVTKVLGVIFLN